MSSERVTAPERGAAATTLVGNQSNKRHLDCTPPEPRSATVDWFGDGSLMLTEHDAIRAHEYEAETFPDYATPLERFDMWSDALLTAQAWTIADTPHLPTIEWWHNVHYAGDSELARTIERVAGLVQGEPPVLDFAWRECWRRNLLPPLLGMAEGRQRRRLRRSTLPYEELDLLAEFERLTGGPGRRQGREVVFRCPLHDDRTPSLYVNPDKKRWICFGCQRGGGPGALRRELAA